MYPSLRAGALGLSVLGLFAFSAATLAPAAPARAADVKLLYGIPSLQASQAWFFVAQAKGFWKDQGLDVEDEVLGGPQNTAALVSGDVQFAAQSPTIMTAIAHQQPMIAIAAVVNAWMDEIVISKEAAAKTGLTVANSTVDQRIKALKGMTLAMDAPNTIIDGFLEHALKLGGLDPTKDVTITPIAPTAVNPALVAHRIDGFSMPPPWTTIAAQNGTGVIWLSGVRGDMPDIIPFVFSNVAANKAYCEKNPDICTKFVTGVVKAIAFMKSNPDESLALVAPQFKGTDPALIRDGFMQQLPTLSTDGRFTEAGWQKTQKAMTETGLLKPSENFSKFEGVVYTNAYIK